MGRQCAPCAVPVSPSLGGVLDIHREPGEWGSTDPWQSNPSKGSDSPWDRAVLVCVGAEGQHGAVLEATECKAGEMAAVA